MTSREAKLDAWLVDRYIKARNKQRPEWVCQFWVECRVMLKHWRARWGNT